jgi:hypothetical protein
MLLRGPSSYSLNSTSLATLIRDLILLASYTICIMRVSLFRRCRFSSLILEISLFSREKVTLERIIVVIKIERMILFKRIRFEGVFLSESTFLKSLMILLKD